MAKILDASCESEVVTVSGAEIEVDLILSEGLASSEGVLIIDKDKTYYVAKTSPDLLTTIEKVSDAITKISDILTAIGTGMTGSTTAPPGTLAADVAEITAVVTELTTLKDNLK